MSNKPEPTPSVRLKPYEMKTPLARIFPYEGRFLFLLRGKRISFMIKYNYGKQFIQREIKANLKFGRKNELQI